MNKLWIVICLALVSVGYLFFQNLELRKQNNELETSDKLSAQSETKISQESLQNKAKCQKDGQSFYDGKKQEEIIEGAIAYTVFGNQNYVFNQELNTCLVSWEDSKLYRGEGGYDIHIRHITDIYRNSDVYSWWQKTLSPFDVNKAEDKLGNEAEYNQQIKYYGLY